MKKVALVLLPNPQLSTPTMHINLGVLYIASTIKQAGHGVKVIDLRGEKDVCAVDLGKMRDVNCVCLSATSGEIKFAKKLNKLIKKTDPKIKTIIGGAHASLYPKDCRGFDVVVVGEGEKIIVDIIENNLTGIFKQERIKNLDEIHSPDWDLLPPEQMFSETLLPGEKYGKTTERGVTLIGSRGCSFNCAFCANIHRAPVTFLSPRKMYQEVKLLCDKYNVNNFRFVDDMFTLNKNWLRAVCERFATLNIKYRCHTRADSLTQEDLRLLKTSGCVELAIGVESGDPKVLKLVNKKETVDQFTKAVNMIKDVGIGTKVYLMSGLPGETEYSLEQTFNFMRKASPDKWTLSQFTPYPGCDIWKNPRKYGVNIVNTDFENYWNFTDTVTYELIGMFDSQQLRQRYKDLYRLLRSDEWKK